MHGIVLLCSLHDKSLHRSKTLWWKSFSTSYDWIQFHFPEPKYSNHNSLLCFLDSDRVSEMNDISTPLNSKEQQTKEHSAAFLAQGWENKLRTRSVRGVLSKQCIILGLRELALKIAWSRETVLHFAEFCCKMQNRLATTFPLTRRKPDKPKMKPNAFCLFCPPHFSPLFANALFLFRLRLFYYPCILLFLGYYHGALFRMFLCTSLTVLI